MNSLNDIRSAFLDYFKRQNHQVLPSSSLVPHNDPTLMFANAGMNQFKDIFTGKEKPKSPRAATSQKCVRAGGKHNDLDNVGYTARHHTFFEMLGNFSFGDYFKEEAIHYGWEFLTREMGINPEKLCVTVYHDDDVAWNQWKKITGFADHKIIRIATADNFWSMGDTGPCGPCSEIFYDHGDKIAGGPPGSPDADGDRFVEVWNLVFMQYEQLADGSRINLPKPSIDTGMGLERITAVIQGVHNNYDIDLFKALINASRLRSGNEVGNDASHRIIADHLRSACFLIADGVMPSNEGRGYVLRRIMRRAMRHAHIIGCEAPLMHLLVNPLVQLMGDQYPELKRAEAAITENLRSEEERFKQTLERGLKLLDEEVQKIPSGFGVISAKDASTGVGRMPPDNSIIASSKKFPGDIAFKLYDTYGFPLDLTQDILRGRGMSVDTAGFDSAMERQKTMARDAWKGSGEQAVGNLWFALKEKLGPVEFVGYDEDVSDAKIIAIVKDGTPVDAANAGEEVYIVLDRTPFYGESGGQVGDVGTFKSVNSTVVATIMNTQKPLEHFHVHQASVSGAIKVGDAIRAEIDNNMRSSIRSNHSATHLLHKALRDKLGEHVTQKGSLVAADRLRFDFSHGKSVSKEEIAQIEKEVNDIIAQAEPVCMEEMAPDEAIAKGAMALFGEKYGEKVRVLRMGRAKDADYSVELCGGTHVRNTSDIGAFKITSEGSVASGIRRMEAVTGEAVREFYIETLSKQQEQLQKLFEDHKTLASDTKETLSPFDKSAFEKASLSALPKLFENASVQQLQSIERLQELNKKLQKEQAEAKKKQALAAMGEVKKEMVGDVGFIAQHVEGLPAKELRPLAENLLKQAEPGVVAAFAPEDGKASVVIAVSKALAKKYSAVDLVKIAVEKLGGKGGGGKPDFAQGGGPDASQIQNAIDAIKAAL